jgi:hypothetical protein
VVRPQGRTAERKIAAIAGTQHGVVTREQLLDAGLTPGEIRQRLLIGSLLREHRGVYRVGHRAPSVEAHYMAAVLACGNGALLRGRAAAHLLGLLKGAAPPPEVTTLTERRLRRVATRRARRAGRAPAVTWRGVPVTAVAATLVDLAATLTAADLARACHEAGVLHGTTPADVEAALDRRPNATGSAKLRRIIRGDEPVTLSALERRFVALVRRARLPVPQTNKQASGRRVDCRWPEHRLTVELDSYRYHSSRHAWEQDRRREREARARGDEFRRYTYGDVFDEPSLMLAELTRLLQGSRPA